MEQAPKRVKITQDIHLKPRVVWSMSADGWANMTHWQWMDGTYSYPCLACKKPTSFKFDHNNRFLWKKAPEVCGTCYRRMWRLMDDAEWKDNVQVLWLN